MSVISTSYRNFTMFIKEMINKYRKSNKCKAENYCVKFDNYEFKDNFLLMNYTINEEEFTHKIKIKENDKKYLDDIKRMLDRAIFTNMWHSVSLYGSSSYVNLSHKKCEKYRKLLTMVDNVSKEILSEIEIINAKNITFPYNVEKTYDDFSLKIRINDLDGVKNGYLYVFFKIMTNYIDDIDFCEQYELDKDGNIELKEKERQLWRLNNILLLEFNRKYESYVYRFIDEGICLKNKG